ncbi:hypothetical protein [Cognaticolwellia beringensis]|nr:hypothetical protein [Cognaticolwellia beringensis]
MSNMKIKELFTKDIERKINGVVKAESTRRSRCLHRVRRIRSHQRAIYPF